MRPSNLQLKTRLGDRVPDQLSSEIDAFEHEIALRKQGKIEDRIFAEVRLRRGAYGQRYDNGQRSDGQTTRTIPYPDVPTKGPSTLWDAPGMQRIKIPYGGLNAPQMETLADLCEEYSDGIAHITTRQMTCELHFIHIEDTPAIMRRLASVGITTREACGNSVRNVTGCPIAGVCRDQTFERHAVRESHHVLSYAGPSRCPVVRPQIQNLLLRLQRKCLRPRAPPRFRRHRGHKRRRCRKIRRGFELWVGGGLGPRAPASQALRRVRSRRRNSADLPGHRTRLRASRREEEPQHRAPQVPSSTANSVSKNSANS